MKRRLAFLVAVLCFLVTGTAYPLTGRIGVSGSLKDQAGLPVEGNYQFKLVFYTTNVSLNSIAFINRYVDVAAGDFSFSVPAPTALADLKEAWYSVAVDLDRNGFDPKDEFQRRYYVCETHPPILLEPAKFLETLGGGSGWGSVSNIYDERLMVYPFTAPPTGLTFKKMSVYAYPGAGATFSFGVYDSSGKRLYWSGELHDQGNANLLSVSINGELKPNQVYLIAYGWKGSFQRKISLTPASPVTGNIPGGAPNGVIPASFDLSKIEPAKTVSTDYFVGISVNFSN